MGDRGGWKMWMMMWWGGVGGGGEPRTTAKLKLPEQLQEKLMVSMMHISSKIADFYIFLSPTVHSVYTSE